MDVFAYKEKIMPYMDAILASGDVSETAVISMAAICSIAIYAQSEREKQDKIAEEFQAAESYLQDYALKSDPEYLAMAADEVSHGRKPLIELKDRLHYADKAELFHYEAMFDWHNSLMARIEKYKSSG